MPRRALSLALAPAAAALLACLPAAALAQAAAPPSPQVAQLLSAARMWESKNRPDVARGIVEKALLIDPRQPDALALLGLIALRSNRPAEAGRLLAQLRQLAPGHPATQELADAYRIATTDKVEMANVRLMARAGQSGEAWRRLQALFPHGAPSGDLARDYYRIMAGTDGGRARAIAELRRRVARDPDDLALALVLADLLTDRSATRLEGLGMIYRVYQRQDSNRGEALELWRRALNSAGASDPAYYVWYQRYLKEAPGDPEAQRALEALDKQAQAQRQRESDPAYRARQRGLAQLDRGDTRAAAASLEQAYRGRRNDGETVGALGLVRLREGRHDEARALFERALRLDPDNAGKWRGLARTAAVWGAIAKANAANSQGQPRQAEAYAHEALRLEPGNASAQRALADALVAQRKWPQAEALLRPLATGRKPDLDALRSLAQVLRDSGREAEVEPLVAGVAPRLAGSDAELRRMRAELLSLQADRLLEQRSHSAAMAKLEDAVRLTPDDPWLRYRLARLYRDLQLPALGRAVMEEGLAAAPGAQMRYAAALYLNSLDDVDGARALLAQVPAAERSAGMRELAANLEAQRLLGEARLAAARGQEDQARALLERAAAQVPDDPQMLASVGREWIALGEPDRGLKLVRDWLEAHPQDPAVAVRLRYGELLASAGRDRELPAWLADARARPGATAEQQAYADDQLLRLALRTAGHQLDAGDLRGAAATLAAVPAAQQSDRRWLLARADLREARGDYRGAMADAGRVLAAHPGDAEARLAQARLFERLGQRRQAEAIVREVLADTPEEDVDTRLAVARRFTAQGREQDAAEVVGPLRRRYPERSDLAMQAGRIAQSRGDYDQAAALYREAGVRERAEGELPGPDGRTASGRALAGLAQRREGQLAAAWIPYQDSGERGISQFHATEVPLYLRIPDGYAGHYFFHADSVFLNAGTLPAGDYEYAYRYGKIAALGSAGLASSGKAVKGVAPAAGYEYGGAYDSWRADLGSSPLGFPVHSLLGGFLYRHAFPGASFSFDLSRRPVTNSQLSYAGGRDPATGQKWGGVVRNSLTLRGAYDVGRGSLFASLAYGVLTGRDVPSNRELRLRGGLDWPLFQRPDQRLTSGLVGNYWRYQRNEHFYTFGNGGYYSPQRYLSLAVPLDWSGRRGRWSWELQGSVGSSRTDEDVAPYYPTRPDLQRLAAARMAAADLGSPYFGGGSGGGFSYTLAGALEYRATPFWVLGARFQIDRSHDYAPNVGMLYLRRYFEPREGPVPFPPNPVKPYSAY